MIESINMTFSYCEGISDGIAHLSLSWIRALNDFRAMRTSWIVVGVPHPAIFRIWTTSRI